MTWTKRCTQKACGDEASDEDGGLRTCGRGRGVVVVGGDMSWSSHGLVMIDGLTDGCTNGLTDG